MTDTPTATSPSGQGGTGLAFAYVTTLFFAWGFATSLIDPLIAAVKKVFDLSFAEATLTASAWFIAYAVVSVPAAALLSRLGYSRSIISALAVMVLGCLIIPAATLVDEYMLVLLGLFVIASGVTLLQVAANPLVAALGSRKSSHARLNFSQFFNSLGTTLGPLLGSTVLLTGGVFAAGAVVTEATRGESLRSIDLAFLGLGAVFAVVALFIFSARKKINAAAAASGGDAGVASPLRAFGSKWALLGALAIFVYVGAEVTIGGLLTNFLNRPEILNLPEADAGRMVSLYWGGAMVGRFIGALLLTRVKAGVLLAVNTAIAAILCLVVTQTSGTTAAYAAIAVGFFNSIMFPTIFTLTLERSSAPAPATSGLLCTAIVGGAVLPLIGGQIADVTGSLNPVFYVPLAGYLVLVAFAVMAARTRVADADAAPAPAPH
ncbi:MAG: sugar MFS transporter [Alphaproteobacteria bacterium]|nr:sugar MFS transporter [Alphaproteobacteria bacterium]MBU1525452.1 sugar MFS transporter [Alphaproteobacteria bacterium]MBU2118426.1 sugar MFS transporter [Alphaproteobacteria bacterium]MBU2350854.1 sugar MFS transporter [Alphaproteobacteria bacterium]MBU2381765.1 sugar MFS transporter [Alphaproteobacteria bacterium]